MKKKSDSQKEFGYKLMRPFVTIKFKNKYHPVVFGKENIPEKGGIVVCGNHRHVDDQYNALIATKRVVHMLAKDEYFKGKKNGSIEWPGVFQLIEVYMMKMLKAKQEKYLIIKEQ